MPLGGWEDEQQLCNVVGDLICGQSRGCLGGCDSLLGGRLWTWGADDFGCPGKPSLWTSSYPRTQLPVDATQPLVWGRGIWGGLGWKRVEILWEFCFRSEWIVLLQNSDSQTDLFKSHICVSEVCAVGEGRKVVTAPLRILKIAFIKSESRCSRIHVDLRAISFIASSLFYTKGPTELLIENPVMHCHSTYKVLCLNTSHILAGHEVGTTLPPVIHCSLSQARVCWPRDKPPLSFPFLKNLYWSIVDFQCCISFRCAMKWFTYTYTYSHSIFGFFSHIGFGFFSHCRVLSRVHCAI